MNRFDTPKEPQQQDIIFALVALFGCTLLCFWPQLMQWLLECLKP